MSREKQLTMTSIIESGDHLTETEIEVLREVVKTLRSLRYGSLTITIHDAQIVEFQRNEKFRVQKVKSK